MSENQRFSEVQKWSIELKGINVNGIASRQDLFKLVVKSSGFACANIFSKSTIKTAEQSP